MDNDQLATVSLLQYVIEFVLCADDEFFFFNIYS